MQRNFKVIVGTFFSMMLIITAVVLYQFVTNQLEINAKNEKMAEYKHKLASYYECAKQTAEVFRSACNGLS